MPYRKVGALEACWYMICFKLKEALCMPRMPDHPCAHPGCPRLVPRGRKYCDAHAGQHPEETRSASSRGYGKRWQKASKAFLHRHPLCAECQRNGRYIAATVVDHIMNGPEYKDERRILMKNLSGHCAFRTEEDKERWQQKQNEKRDALKAMKQATEVSDNADAE